MTYLQEVKIYIDNIQKVHRTQFVEAEYRTPFVQHKIVEHLKNMIPGLPISSDFRLVTKPKYLNRLIRRHTPIQLPTNNDSQLSGTCSAANATEDRNDSQVQTSHAHLVSHPSLNPTLIIDKCDALLREQRQNSDLRYSKHSERAEIPNPTNQETDIGECDLVAQSNGSEAETIPSTATIHASASNDRMQSHTTTTEDTTQGGQSIAILSAAAESSNNIFGKQLNCTIGSRNDEQNIIIARKKSDLLKNPALISAKPVNMNEEATSSSIQPNYSRINAVNENVQVQNALEQLDFETNQMTNLPENIEVNQNDIDASILPPSTSHLPGEAKTIYDWEVLLEKYQIKIEKRHRIQRKIVLKREKAHVMETKRLKSIVKTLKHKNHKLQTRMQHLEMQQNERLQNTIAETKRKKWCWNCQMELKVPVLNLPMCKDCLNRNW